MTDDEYWACYNPKNWDKDTWISGACVAVMFLVCYLAINIFY